MPDTDMILLIGGIAAGVVVLICLVYGIIRKFSRLTWIGWQLLIGFGLLRLLALIPLPDDETLAFFVSFGGLIASVAAVLGLEIWLRHFLFHRPRLPGKGARVCNRLFGGLTALLGFLMFFYVLGGFGLHAVEYFMGETLLDIPVWTDLLSETANDLLLFAMFFLIARAGYRLGLLRAIYYLLAFALTAFAFVCACYITMRVGFAVSLSDKIAGCFDFHPIFSAFLGDSLTVLICFIVLFIGVMLIMALLHWLIRVVCTVRAVGAIDAVIAAVIAVAIFLAFVCLLYFGAAYLAGGDFAAVLEDLFASAELDMDTSFVNDLEDVFADLGRFFASSPVSKSMYENNFLFALFGRP